MLLERLIMKAHEKIDQGDPVCFVGKGAGLVRARADTLHLRNVIGIAEVPMQAGAIVTSEELVLPGQAISILNPPKDDEPERMFFLGSEGGIVAGVRSLKSGEFRIGLGYRVDDTTLYVSIQDYGKMP